MFMKELHTALFVALTGVGNSGALSPGSLTKIIILLFN